MDFGMIVQAVGAVLCVLAAGWLGGPWLTAFVTGLVLLVGYGSPLGLLLILLTLLAAPVCGLFCRSKDDVTSSRAAYEYDASASDGGSDAGGD